MLPASYLPDKYVDELGNEYEFPPEKKQDMKNFALYFISLFALFNISLSYYLYRVVKKWARKETVIEYMKAKRISHLTTDGRSCTTTRPSVRT